MKLTLRNIIGAVASSTFLFASVFNDQMFYNAALFNAEPQTVEAKVRDNHTDDEDGTVNEKGIVVNMAELSKFYSMIR